MEDAVVRSRRRRGVNLAEPMAEEDSLLHRCLPWVPSAPRPFCPTHTKLSPSSGPVLQLLPLLGMLGSPHDGPTLVFPWPPLSSTPQPHFRFCYISLCLFLRAPVTRMWLCPCPHFGGSRSLCLLTAIPPVARMEPAYGGCW